MKIIGNSAFMNERKLINTIGELHTHTLMNKL